MLIHPDDLPCNVENTIIAVGGKTNISDKKFKSWVCDVIQGNNTTMVDENIDFTDHKSLAKRTSQKTEFEDADKFDRKECSSFPNGKGMFVEGIGSKYNRYIFIEHWESF